MLKSLGLDEINFGHVVFNKKYIRVCLLDRYSEATECSHRYETQASLRWQKIRYHVSEHRFDTSGRVHVVERWEAIENRNYIKREFIIFTYFIQWVSRACSSRINQDYSSDWFVTQRENMIIFKQYTWRYRLDWVTLLWCYSNVYLYV